MKCLTPLELKTILDQASEGISLEESDPVLRQCRVAQIAFEYGVKQGKSELIMSEYGNPKLQEAGLE